MLGVIKVVFCSRKCMKILVFLLRGRGGWCTFKLFFLQGFWWGDWEWCLCTLSRGMGSRDYTRCIWIRFLIDKIVCRITLKVSPNCLNLLCFGSFAGAEAHHQGLRRLKPCQFQRTVYWHCECDKLCSNARFELLAVCCSWTRGRKANEPCLTRLQSAFVEVPSKVESAWTTFGARFKAGQRLVRENIKLFGGRLSRSKICQISQDAMGSDSCCLAAWLRLLLKRELIELLFGIFPTLAIYVGSRRSVL